MSRGFPDPWAAFRMTPAAAPAAPAPQPVAQQTTGDPWAAFRMSDPPTPSIAPGQPTDWRQSFRAEVADLERRNGRPLSRGAQMALAEQHRQRADQQAQGMEILDPSQAVNLRNLDSPAASFGAGLAHTISPIITGPLGVVAPETAAGLREGVQETYGTPQGVAGTAGELGGTAIKAVGTMALGPVGMGLEMAAEGAGGVRSEIASRRAEGEEISGTDELFGALGTGAVEGASGYLGGKIFQKVGKTLGESVPVLRQLIAEGGEQAGRTAAKELARKALTTAGMSAAEGLEEAATQLADNLIAQSTFDPEQDAAEGVVKSGLFGAGLAPLIGGGVNVLGRSEPTTRRRRMTPDEAQKEADTLAAKMKGSSVEVDGKIGQAKPADRKPDTEVQQAPAEAQIGSKVDVGGSAAEVIGITDTGMLEIRFSDGMKDVVSPEDAKVRTPAMKVQKPRVRLDTDAALDAEAAKEFPDLVKQVPTDTRPAAEQSAAADAEVKRQADEAEVAQEKTLTPDQVAEFAGRNTENEIRASGDEGRIAQDIEEEIGLQRGNIESLDHRGEFVLRDVPVDLFETVNEPEAATVEQYAARKGGKVPPIVAGPVARGSDPLAQGKELLITDGKHRLNAARKRGEKTIQAMVPAWYANQELDPRTVGRGRNKSVRRVRVEAQEYVKQAGLPEPEADAPYVKVNPAKAAEIAQAYEGLEHEPNNPEVKASYDAFKTETKKQWDFLKSKGVKFEPWTGEGQPYKNSDEMVADVAKGHLYFFRGGDIPKDHPLAEASGEGDLTYNDIFRAVHDYFGHAKDGNQFGPRGEENAWVAHSQMYGDLARRAMTTETRGQNSWVNYGPKGEANRANPQNTTYAQQKAGLLPPQFSQVPTGAGGGGAAVPPGGRGGLGNQGPGGTPPGGGGGPSNPINLPNQVALTATATPPVRQRSGIGAIIRAFEHSAANRPADYVAQRDRLGGAKGLARMDVVRQGVKPLERAAKGLGIDLEDRAVQYQIEQVLRGAKPVTSLPQTLQTWVKDQRTTIDKIESEIVTEARNLGMDEFADAVEARMGTFLAVAPIKRAGRTLPVASSRERLNPEVGHFRRDRWVVTDATGKVVGDAPTQVAAQNLMARHVANHTGKQAMLELHEPIPETWRMANEIHDPRHLLGRTVVEGIHLREMLKLIQVAQPHVQTPPKGLTTEQEAEWAKENELGKVVDDRRLGPIKGKYLPVRMAEDFNEAVHVPSDITRLWLTFNSAYKLSKTAFNWSTSMRNIIGNATIFAFADGVSPFNPQNWSFYKQASKAAYNKSDPVWRKMAEANFVGTGGRFAGELRGIFQDAADFDTYLRNSLVRGMQKGVQGVQEFYGAQDDIFKMAAVLKRMKKGMSFDAALAETRHFWPDPSRASKIGKWLSNAPLGSSFARFTDQALRVGGRHAKANPVRFSMIAAAPIMLNALSRAWVGVEDEEEKMLDKARSYAEPLLPWRDSKGRLQTLDMRYIIPLVNDILPEQRNGMLTMPFFGNTPVGTALLEQGGGRDRFTGRQFVNEKMTLAENVGARARQLGKTLAPLPGMLTYGVPAVTQAAQGEGERAMSHVLLQHLGGMNVRTPYIAEREVIKMAQKMMEMKDREQARDLVALWNETYKPRSEKELKMEDVVRGMRANLKRDKNGARDEAAEALLRGDTDGANEIIKEWNEGKSDRLTPLRLEVVRSQAEVFKRQGKER